MTYPTEAQRVAIHAFLGGYYETVAAVPLADAQALVARHFPAIDPVDGMMVSRILRRLGFAKSHAPADTATTVYRRVLRPEEVPY